MWSLKTASKLGMTASFNAFIHLHIIHSFQNFYYIFIKCLLWDRCCETQEWIWKKQGLPLSSLYLLSLSLCWPTINFSMISLFNYWRYLYSHTKFKRYSIEWKLYHLILCKTDTINNSLAGIFPLFLISLYIYIPLLFQKQHYIIESLIFSIMT